MTEWEIVSEFLAPGYKLIAPDGTHVGTYDSMADARSVMTELLETARGIEAVLRSDDVAWFAGTCPAKDDVYPEECCDEPTDCAALSARWRRLRDK